MGRWCVVLLDRDRLCQCRGLRLCVCHAGGFTGCVGEGMYVCMWRGKRVLGRQEGIFLSGYVFSLLCRVLILPSLKGLF